MIRIDLTLEDNRIIGSLGNDGLWHVEVHDCPTGKYFTAQWSQEAFNAAIVLGLGLGEEHQLPESVTDELYKQAEPLFEHKPKECRFIP